MTALVAALAWAAGITVGVTMIVGSLAYGGFL